MEEPVRGIRLLLNIIILDSMMTESSQTCLLRKIIMEAMHLYTVCDEVSRVYVMWLFCKPVGDELPFVRF